MTHPNRRIARTVGGFSAAMLLFGAVACSKSAPTTHTPADAGSPAADTPTDVALDGADADDDSYVAYADEAPAALEEEAAPEAAPAGADAPRMQQ